MLDVAKAMPNVNFHLVMPESTYNELKDDLPNNIIAKYNLSMEEFMKEMCASEIVALPLDTAAPAGLIVLFQAAANMKYIITTDTMTTREYLSDGHGGLFVNDLSLWTAALGKRLGCYEQNHEASGKLLAFLKANCSERKFVDVIELMTKEL